jgi:hypothetical protein
VVRDSNGPKNDPPFAGDDFGYTTVNTPVSGNFVSNDSDPNGNPISVNGTTIVPGGAHTPIGTPVATAQGGTVQFYADGTYTYTPPVGYVGPDNVIYTICDVTVIAPQPLCADAQIHLLIGPGISIAGRVWDDANGNIVINGTEAGTNIAGALFVNLVGADGKVVASVPVNSDGTYNFNNITPATSYSLVLSITQGVTGQTAPAASLPPNWVNTGESKNGVIDAATLGVIDLQNYGYTNTINYNFGIDQLPNSIPQTITITRPTAGQLITLNGGANPPVPGGTDLEDGLLGATNTIVITALPTNSILLYNGLPVTAGQVITGFDPSLLQVQVTAGTLASTGTSFQFAYRDAAGKEDPTPATYTLQWVNPLPVTLVSFNGVTKNCDAILQWKTSQEINAARFVIEQSTDGVNFIKAAEVMASNNPFGNAYQLSVVQATSAITYYRLKMVDKDGTAKYSSLIALKGNCIGRDYMVVYPNPVLSGLTLSFSTGYRGAAKVVIQNALGQQMENRKIQINASANLVNLDMSGYVSGSYIIYLQGQNGEKIGTGQKIIKE